MKAWSFCIVAGAALLAAPVFFPAAAHCPDQVPAVKLQYPSEGVVIHDACYAKYGTCFVDTFYSAKLKEQLVERYKASKYAVFAYVDSVQNYETYDSTFYQGQLYFIDTFTTEKVHLSIHTFLKDTMPVRKLTFVDRWIAFKGDPFSITYFPLIDTPFVAFFNAYDSLEQIGIGPMDGCFFEPTAFTLKGGKIHKKGLVGDRMPGVSVTIDEFFTAIGHAPVPVPPVSIRRIAGKPPRYPRLRSRYRYDAMGRRLDGRDSPISVFSVWDTRPGRNEGQRGPTDGISKP